MNTKLKKCCIVLVVVPYIILDSVFNDIIMKKLLIVLFLFLYGCAPHGHFYRLLKNDSKISVKIGVECFPYEKIIVVNNVKNDSIKFRSKIFGNKWILMDHPDSINKYYHKRIRINDRKFHKLFNNDTLELHIFNKGNDIKLLFKSVPDSYTK